MPLWPTGERKANVLGYINLFGRMAKKMGERGGRGGEGRKKKKKKKKKNLKGLEIKKEVFCAKLNIILFLLKGLRKQRPG